MERVLDVLIFGDGPAARLAAIALSGLGLRVVRALPRPGLGPPPTARHSHILATTMGPAAAVLDRSLAQEIAARTEPQCRWRSFSGPDCAEYTAPRLSRAAVDAALDICIGRRPFETWRDVQITGREGARLCAGSRQGQGCFDLVIDATGAHRATLPMLARLGLKIGYEDTGRVKLYQTLELALLEARPGVRVAVPIVPPVVVRARDLEAHKVDRVRKRAVPRRRVRADDVGAAREEPRRGGVDVRVEHPDFDDVAFAHFPLVVARRALAQLPELDEVVRRGEHFSVGANDDAGPVVGDSRR